MGLSKSKYTTFCQCKKKLWLDEYHSELAKEDFASEEILKSGNVVGDLAMSFLGDFVEVTTYNSDGSLNLKEMVLKTKEEINNKTLNICEASFFYNENYCAVDILHNDGDGYSIYEVKSSTKVEPYHLLDASYQYFVLKNNGLKINNVFLVHINPFYVRKDKLDIKKLFKAENITKEVIENLDNVSSNIDIALEVLNNKEEPNVDLGLYCEEPFVCPYQDYCKRNLVSPNVFSLYRMGKKKMYDYYKQGIISYEDIRKSKIKLNKTQERQISFQLDNLDIIVDKKEVKKFLELFKGRLYFLDFETMQEAIPPFVDSKPYSQIPFQYSLHILDENNNLVHKGFLGKEGEDPRRKIAESLCNDIPLDVISIAYNKAFECQRLQELADLFPDLSSHLLNIKDNMLDLLVPFQKGYVYKKEMEGSFSIKKVLPAFFNEDKNLDYHSLPGVKNGKEAMQVFVNLPSMNEEDIKKAREGLWEYCKLDTLAMVKLYEKLKELVNEN